MTTLHIRQDAPSGAVINSGWGVRYDVEQLLEHAVVHVLRHRRQIEKFMRRGLLPAPTGAD